MSRYTTIEINDIIKRYERNMLFFVIKKVSYDNELAKDLYQDALIKIFLGLQTGMYKPGTGSIATWMYKVCSNVILDYYRRLKKNPAIPNSDLFDEELFEQGSSFFRVVQRIVSDQVSESQDREYKELSGARFNLIEAYINKLKPKYREPLYNQIILGYKSQDIAIRLGIEDVTIRTQLFHGKRKVKAMMIRDGIIKEEIAA